MRKFTFIAAIFILITGLGVGILVVGKPQFLRPFATGVAGLSCDDDCQKYCEQQGLELPQAQCFYHSDVVDNCPGGTDLGEIDCCADSSPGCGKFCCCECSESPTPTPTPAICVCKKCIDVYCREFPQKKCPCTNECENDIDCRNLTPTSTPVETPTPTPSGCPLPEQVQGVEVVCPEF